MDASSYNLAAQTYNQVLKNKEEYIDSLPRLIPVFLSLSEPDSLRLDAWHALGLIYHYWGQADSALIYYDSLANTNYFDTLQLYPNLETLVGERSRIRQLAEIEQGNNSVYIQVEYAASIFPGASLRIEVSLATEQERPIPGLVASRKTIRNKGLFQDTLALPYKTLRLGEQAGLVVARLIDPTNNTEVDKMLIPITIYPPSGLIVGAPYCITNIVPAGLALRNRELDRIELNILNDKTTSQEGESLHNETYHGVLYNGDEVTLIGENAFQFHIQLPNGRSGYIAKTYETKPTLGYCLVPSSPQSAEGVEPTIAMSGVVIDNSSNAPLAGAEVWLVPPASGGTRSGGELKALTDRSGNFQISGLDPATNYELRVAKEGYGLRGRAETKSGAAWSAKPTTQYLVRLNNQLEVKGKVTDINTGEGLDGALISIIGEGFSSGTNSVADGSFEKVVEKAEAGTKSFSIVVAKDGYTTRNFSINNYSSGQAVELQLQAEGAIENLIGPADLLDFPSVKQADEKTLRQAKEQVGSPLAK